MRRMGFSPLGISSLLADVSMQIESQSGSSPLGWSSLLYILSVDNGAMFGPSGAMTTVYPGSFNNP
jgi:uncharacterized membrane protein YczE